MTIKQIDPKSNDVTTFIYNRFKSRIVIFINHDIKIPCLYIVDLLKCMFHIIYLIKIYHAREQSIKR